MFQFREYWNRCQEHMKMYLCVCGPIHFDSSAKRTPCACVKECERALMCGLGWMKTQSCVSVLYFTQFSKIIENICCLGQNLWYALTLTLHSLAHRRIIYFDTFEHTFWRNFSRRVWCTSFRRAYIKKPDPPEMKTTTTMEAFGVYNKAQHDKLNRKTCLHFVAL